MVITAATIIAYIIIPVISYLLGSLNFGVILSKKLQNDDVRNHGSGNAGTTNMLRNYGKKLAVATIIGDMLKVGVAVGIAYLIKNFISPGLFEYFIFHDSDVDYNVLLKLYAGLFCVIGHIFPCFFGFKGGKGVATAGGMVFIIDWRIALILLAVFFVILLTTKYVSLGSIVMAMLFPVLMLIFHKSLLISALSLVFTFIVVVAHRENIKKLLNHTESKIGDRKKEN